MINVSVVVISIIHFYASLLTYIPSLYFDRCKLHTKTTLFVRFLILECTLYHVGFWVTVYKMVRAML